MMDITLFLLDFLEWFFPGFHVSAQTGVLDCIIHFLLWSLGYEARVKEEQEYHEKTTLMSNSLHEKMRQIQFPFSFFFCCLHVIHILLLVANKILFYHYLPFFFNYLPKTYHEFLNNFKHIIGVFVIFRFIYMINANIYNMVFFLSSRANC